MNGPDLTPKTENKETLTADKLRGVMAALSTPLLGDEKLPQVDVESLFREVHFVHPYVNCLFPAGNVGEGSQMSFDDWSTAIQATIDARNKYALSNTPVLAGVLRGSAAEISLFSQKAQELGADGTVIAPMYGGNEDLALATAIGSCNLPIILYNNPALHDEVELPIEFVRRAKENFPNRVIGIKSSTKNFDYFKQILELRSERFKVFQGNTADAIKSLELGADGIVPAEATTLARVFKNLYQAFKDTSNPPPEKLGEFVRYLEYFNTMKQKSGLETAELIKHILVEKGVFKSARMYY